MSRKVITMEQKFAAVFAAVASGRSTVVQVCADLDISRDTYYRYRSNRRSDRSSDSDDGG